MGNILYLVGILLSFAFTVFGIVSTIDANGIGIDFNKLGNFFDISSVLIVIGGTLSVVIANYPKEVKYFIKHMSILMKSKAHDPMYYVNQITELASVARKNGLLALEEMANQEKDPFFKQAIMLLVDANDPDKVRSILQNDMERTCERHQVVIGMYDKGAGAAPAFGMIGTLVGLINMLRNLGGDGGMDSLGPDMSTAMLTTFYGSLLAHVVFTPISSNLTARDEEEVLCRQIIIEGVMSIQSGENPKFVRENLLMFINQKTREKVAEVPSEGGGSADKG